MVNKDTPQHIARNLYKLPPGDVPSTTECITLCIPTGTAYKRQLFGALYEFTKWNNYERDASQKGTLIAQAWRKAILEGLLSCYQFRNNGGLLQFSNDGGVTWSSVPQASTGDSGYDVREDGPMEPGRTGDNIPCLAAANATAVFVELHRELSDWYSQAGPILSFLYSVGNALNILFGAFGSLFGLSVDMNSLALDILAHQNALTIASFTANIQKELTCLLNEEVDINGNWDATALQAVLTDIAGKDGDMWALIGHYIEDVAGIVGLNNAGTTTSVSTFDCDECELWCYEFDFKVSENSFTVTSTPRGGWQAGTGFYATYSSGPVEAVWISRTFSSVDIIRAEIYITTNNAGSITWLVDGETLDTDPAGSGSVFLEFAQEVTLGEFEIRYNAENRSDTWLTKLKLWGRGVCPFGESNC